MAPSNQFLSLASLFLAPLSTFASIPLPMGGSMIISRQDNSCPGYGDCDCTDWGYSCAMTDWSWFNCNLPDFADSCNAPPPPPPSSTPAPPPPPSTWKDPYGPVASGSFTWFILPRKQVPANNQGPNSDSGLGQITIFTQDGDTFNKLGPFTFSCQAKNAETTQTPYSTQQTTLPWQLSLTPGHACSTGVVNDNLDGLTLYYANQEFNVPAELGKRCTTHDNGVSCECPLHP